MRRRHPIACEHGRVRLGIALLASTLAFAAAGCGGDNSSEAENWANSVCSTVSDWQGEIAQTAQEVQTELESPNLGTVATIETQIQSAVTATQKLVTDLKAIDAPDIDSGTQAKQQVDALASQLQSAVNIAKNSIDALPEDTKLTDLAQQLLPLAPAIQSLATSASNTVKAIETSGDELKEGFESAEACKQYR
jgi:septal ring factor EnvC (AmiA/AmiB activator)